MGLHATAYEHATLLDPHERGEACWESGHVLAHAYRAFERSTTGLVMGRCYEVGGATLDIDHSYGGYGDWRRALCRAALGVKAKRVWADPDLHRDRPFFELIHFADNEGTIGPVACAALAADFAEQAERVRPLLALRGDFADDYDQWGRMFVLAADTGLVTFS